jgi:hypothetical protein
MDNVVQTTVTAVSKSVYHVVVSITVNTKKVAIMGIMVRSPINTNNRVWFANW